MKALILAAGPGTRLRQLTRRRPKSMLPIGGKPLLAHIVAWLRAAGIVEIAINLHHCPDVIPGYLGDGHRLGVSICYSHEDRLLGTAGAAKRLQHVLDEPFVVVYGDVFSNFSLARLINAHTLHCGTNGVRAAATLALYRVSDPAECGLIDLGPDGRIRQFVEKPPADQVFTDLAFSGVLVCEPAILDWIPDGAEVDFGRDLFPALLAADVPLWGQEIAASEFLVDIGTLCGYLRALEVCAARLRSDPA